MTLRHSVSLLLGTLALTLALPAAAVPQCGDDEKDGKKDEDKNPSAQLAAPSASAPQCGDDEKDGKKDEDKNPSVHPG